MDVNQMQYMPGDPRLIDQLVCELKSKGIFDQFRKECIADVDTRPAYQNLRQRVESSVAMFLARQTWKPELNKNQLREKLRKHILDANYLEQGVERIVDQVVNPKVASIFIPQVEDLVYNYLGIPKQKSITENTNGNVDTTDLLPDDLEAVSPGSVKSNEPKDTLEEIHEEISDEPMEVDDPKKEIEELKIDVTEENKENIEIEKEESQSSGVIDLTSRDSEMSFDRSTIPLPTEGIKPENIPLPKNSPPKIEPENIELPKEPYPITKIPLPDEIPPEYFKHLQLNSENDESSSDSSIIRNMSPLTPVRNFDDENSCDAKQGFEDNDVKQTDNPVSVNTFRFTIETSNDKSNHNDNKNSNDKDQNTLTYKFASQVKTNTENTTFEDSSNSNNLHIDYESDANNKNDRKIELEQSSDDTKKRDDKKTDKTSHHSKDRHSSSKDRKSSSSSKHSSRDKDSKSKDRDRDKSRDDSRSKSHKDSKDSKHRHSSSHRSSSSKDSKSKSSSSSQKPSSRTDDKRRDKSSDTKKDHRSLKDSKSTRSDKDRKSSSSSKSKDEKKKESKKVDDHYSASGRGSNSRRSTDRDSNDGNSSSSKSLKPTNKSTEIKSGKTSSSKSDNTPSSSNETSPSDQDTVVEAKDSTQKPVRVENHLETPILTKTPLKFPEVILKKPKIASNFEEARQMMKMRKFLDEEQRRMNQEAALLLEFHANVRPSLSQVYSNISGPELEFACVKETVNKKSSPTQETNQPETNKMIEDFLNNTTNESVDAMDNTDESQLDDDDDLENHLKSYSISKADPNNVTLKNDTRENSVETLKAEEESIIVNSNAEDYNEIKLDNVDAHVLDIIGIIPNNKISDDRKEELQYFNEQDKFNAELERTKFSEYLQQYLEKTKSKKKTFLVNCSQYGVDILKDIAKDKGDITIVNYNKNGHLKTKEIKEERIDNEVALSVNKSINIEKAKPKVLKTTILSPKSECSFELSSDYDAKLDEMMNSTSRQQIMEIIFGGVISEISPSDMQIDYCNESSIDVERPSKRGYSEISSNDNNNLAPVESKVRKISDSEQISSTTEELIVTPNQLQPIKSKYLGKAKRVGLPKPKRPNLSSSPSSDKSVENYEQNEQGNLKLINGRIKTTIQRNSIQRYDTSDLYKPKLHYLSKRSNIDTSSSS